MALPRPVIQLNPPGLLSLLGLKNGGVAPPNFGDVTLPTFELSDWYLRASQEAIPGASVAIPNGANTGLITPNFTVPLGEWWYVRHLRGTVITAAADTVEQWALGFSVGSATYVVSDPFASVPVNSARFGCARDPFWVPPGAGLGGFFARTVIAGASVLDLQALITRCKV